MHRLILISLLFIGLRSEAQTLAGSWFGKADVVLDGTFNNYLTQLIIKQKEIKSRAFSDTISEMATKAFM